MTWRVTSFRMQTNGRYAVTSHGEKPAAYYLAYFERESLGRYGMADEARAACEAHRAQQEAKA